LLTSGFWTLASPATADLVVVSACIAQTNVNISGIVTDTTGVTPISGAAVQLEKGGFPTTSGADGSFTITGTTGIINSHFKKSLSGKITVFLHNGHLNLNIREKSNISITTFSIQGKTLSAIRKTMEAGSHSVALPSMAAGVCFYRIKTGNEEFVLKSTSPAGVSGGTAISNQGKSTTAITRQTQNYVPINDVIKVEKDGYLNYRGIVTNSDTSGITIKLIIQDAGTVTDVDGNIYHTIRIGNQIWTVENLRTTKYNDSTAIPLVTDTFSWTVITTPGYCNYNNSTNADSIKKFGALYNWYTINPANPKKIAPAGWHVPIDTEWTILVEYIIANGYNWDGTTTGNKIAKSLAAKTDWAADSRLGSIGNNLTMNNRTGFSGLPAGERKSDSRFQSIGDLCIWWSASGYDDISAGVWPLFFNNANLQRGRMGKRMGFSVRLVRDAGNIARNFCVECN
jgi:uncharacterized protein (TIGR02145 family)